MSSKIGVFREGEINGKPFHIYTLSSQTHIPTSSSGVDNELSLPQPLFFCPSFRLKVEMLKRKEDGYSSDGEQVLPISTSPCFPNIGSSPDQQVQSLLDSNIVNTLQYICKQPLLPLSWCNNEYLDDSKYDFDCKACRFPPPNSTSYYLCPTCDERFHKECVEAPLEIKHPSYPFLSLQLYTTPEDHFLKCISCDLPKLGMIYHCPTNNLVMHPLCAMKPVTIIIDHPKRHPHSLIFFPKHNSLKCNVCGVINTLIPTYVCARCVFVVHEDCIYFPFVIRISRHQHRISFTYTLPSGALSCGVCRKNVDNDCGAYACNKCDGYFVHTRCALREDLWDGEELEGVPEEPEIFVEPFKRIADGIILHFSHSHKMKLEMSGVYDEDKYCHACVLPIYEGGYYSCVDQCCDFILHEACAESPLKKFHPLHRRPLTLNIVTSQYNNDNGWFSCDACLRISCGFVYDDPTDGWFRLDIRCASISEPFQYEGHEHPLFLALDPKEEESVTCHICGEQSRYNRVRKLNCIECNYVICFRCATVPYKAMYKHDKHFLTFHKEAEASDQSSWCDVCENKVVYSGDRGFYSCDEYCCTTLHVYCLLGENPYMKPCPTMVVNGEEIRIIRNKTMSRPFCHRRECYKDRCPDRVFYERNNMTFCSVRCTFQ